MRVPRPTIHTYDPAFHIAPLFISPQVHLRKGRSCGGHLEDDGVVKQGVDLSDLDTTAVIMLASTPYNCRVEYTRVLGKHQASEDAYMAKLACCQLMLELLGDPKSFLDALVTCGRTCWWCAPVVAVLNTTGSQMYYIS